MRLFFSVVLTATLLAALSWQTPAAVAQKVQSVDEKATHEQAAILKVDVESLEPTKVHAFCLGPNDEILACCGTDAGEIRVFDAAGKYLRRWELPVQPEAINMAPDGTVLVGGQGELFRYSLEGKQLVQQNSPHAKALKLNQEKLREEARQYLNRRVNSLASRIQTYERMIAQLKKKQADDKISDQEERILKSLEASLKQFQAQQAQSSDEKPKIDEEAVDARVKAMSQRKLRIASISADANNVFIGVPAQTGYGFEVWKVDPSLEKGEPVVSGLRGCCGQMDVRVRDGKLYVAENSRHRVACFNTKGEEILAWGKRDRTGVDGWTSCCNPMNVCFNKTGDVFTAESSSGRIKRFSPDGKFLEYVGDVKLVPGCKNVSIAVSQDGERVYMLDITRNHIVLMKKKDAPSAEPAAVDAEGEVSARQ